MTSRDSSRSIARPRRTRSPARPRRARRLAERVCRPSGSFSSTSMRSASLTARLMIGVGRARAVPEVLDEGLVPEVDGRINPRGLAPQLFEPRPPSVSPPTWTRPAAGRCQPSSMPTRLDLPAPEEPTTATCSHVPTLGRSFQNRVPGRAHRHALEDDRQSAFRIMRRVPSPLGSPLECAAACVNVPGTSATTSPDCASPSTLIDVSAVSIR